MSKWIDDTKSEWMVGEDQRRQLEQVIQITDRHDPQKTKVLIQDYPCQLRILFHTSKDDSRRALRAQTLAPTARRRTKKQLQLICHQDSAAHFLKGRCKRTKYFANRKGFRHFARQKIRCKIIRAQMKSTNKLGHYP
jgi:hypothetical protein